VAKQLADEEEWVLGAAVQDKSKLLDLEGRNRLNLDVRRLYLEEYARTWEQFVNDIKLIHAGNLEQSIQSARILSAQDSPLPQLLRAIIKEVTLVRTDPTEKDLIDKAAESVTKRRDELLKLLKQQRGQPAPSPGTSRLEAIV